MSEFYFNSMNEYNEKRKEYLDKYYMAVDNNLFDFANLWLRKVQAIDKEYKEKCGFDNTNK